MENWAGNVRYRARAVHAPTSEVELAERLAAAPQIRVIGTRHSFTDIADAAELVTLEHLPREITVDPGAGHVRIRGAVTYGELADHLAGAGMALANLASLPHISVAGAIQTATHGSGDANGNLATAVRALTLISSSGERCAFGRGDPEFPGAVVGLGALGAVVAVELDIEPAYEVRQTVYAGVTWNELLGNLEEIFATGYSVSVFTQWGEDAGNVWVKHRGSGPPERLRFGTPATVDLHPIAGIDPANSTAQRGVPGPWFERLPHFRMGFTPSAGEEIQSEYLIPRRHGADAIRALLELRHRIAGLLQVGELRTVAADGLWMSPQYGQDTLGLHFTWRRDQAAVEAVLGPVEAALRPFGARPHWGKLFLTGDRDGAVGSLYPRAADFRALVGRLDPRGALGNPWLHRVLGH